jgi:HSP20 family protein
MNKILINDRNLLNKIWRDDFFDSFFSLVDSNSKFNNENYLNSELKEDKDNYYIKAELPGFERDNIKIDFDNNRLIIRAEKEEVEEVNGKIDHFSEISYGSFSRVFTLSKNINEKGIKAKYQNGILSIEIPKLDKSEVSNINIE